MMDLEQFAGQNSVQMWESKPVNQPVNIGTGVIQAISPGG